MKHLLLFLIALMQLSAATRAIIPGCCIVQNSISFIDPTTGLLARDISTGSPAITMGLSSDGRYAFLVNFEEVAVSFASSVSKIDFLSGKVVANLAYPSGTAASEIAVNPRSNVLYVGYEDTAAAWHIQSLTQSGLQIVNDVILPKLPGTALVVSPAGDLLFAGPYALRTSDLQIVGTIDSTFAISEVAVSQDGSRLYAVGSTAQNTWAVDVVDVKSLSVIQTIPTSLFYANLIALSGDERQVIVAAQNQTSFRVLDLATLTESSYPLPWAPGSVVRLSSGSMMVFGSSPDSAKFPEPAGISIFNTATQQVSNYPTFAAEQLVASPGKYIVALDVSSPAAITGIAPDASVVGYIPLGTSDGQGALDPDDNLILFPLATAQGLQTFNAITLKPEAFIPLPGVSSWVSYAHGAAYALINTNAVARFSPASAQVTGSFTLPPIDYQFFIYNLPTPAVSPDGATLYVAFDYGLGIDPLSETRQENDSSPQRGIAVYDTASTSLLRIIPEPWIGGLAVASDGKHAYATVVEGSGDFALIDLDLRTGKQLRSVRGSTNGRVDPLLGVPLLSADAPTVYAAFNSKIIAVDAATFQVIGNYSTDAAPLQLALTPDGRYLYATAGEAVLILQTPSLNLVGQVPSQSYLSTPVLFFGK